jgi:hypothetical protein
LYVVGWLFGRLGAIAFYGPWIFKFLQTLYFFQNLNLFRYNNAQVLKSEKRKKNEKEKTDKKEKKLPWAGPTKLGV